jgi:hypothetical protein
MTATKRNASSGFALQFMERLVYVNWCARISQALSAGANPAPKGEEPPHRESSFGLMKVTT